MPQKTYKFVATSLNDPTEYLADLHPLKLFDYFRCSTSHTQTARNNIKTE